MLKRGKQHPVEYPGTLHFRRLRCTTFWTWSWSTGVPKAPLSVVSLSPSNDVGMSGIDFATNFYPKWPRCQWRESSAAGRPALWPARRLTTLQTGKMVSWRSVSDLNEEVRVFIFLLFSVKVHRFCARVLLYRMCRSWSVSVQSPKSPDRAKISRGNSNCPLFVLFPGLSDPQIVPEHEGRIQALLQSRINVPSLFFKVFFQWRGG